MSKTKTTEKVLSTGELLGILGTIQQKYDEFDKVKLVIEANAIKYFEEQKAALGEEISKLIEEAAKTQTQLAMQCREYIDDNNILEKKSEEALQEIFDVFQKGISTCEFVISEAQKIAKGVEGWSFGPEKELPQL